MPQAAASTEKSNAILLKIIIGLLSITGTLFGFIGTGILTRLDKLEDKMEVFAQVQAGDHSQLVTMQQSVRDLQDDSRDHTRNYFRLAQLVGLKAEDITYNPKQR